MPKNPIPSTWSLIRPPEPEPDLLTEAELLEVNKVFEPLLALIDQYMDGNPETWSFDAIHEALARAHDYYGGMERYIDAQIAAEEADA